MVSSGIRITDIARRLNLSRSTVDRVINNRGHVAPATAERVREMVQELGYEPNKAAKYLAKRQLHRIAVSYDLPDYFAQQIKRGITSAFDELRNYGASLVLQETNSFLEQKERLESLEDIDALAISVAQPAEAAPLVERFVSRGIPVVTFNTDIPNSERICYVGCDYTEAGRMAGGVMRSIVNPDSSIAILTAQAGVQLLEQRTNGFSAVIRAEQQLHLLPPLLLRYENETESGEAVKELFCSSTPPAGIFCTDVVGLGCAARALTALGLAGRIKLIGYDLNHEVRRLIQQGVVHFTIHQDPYFQGYLPLRILFDHLAEGRPINQVQIMAPLNLLFKENLSYWDGQPHIVDYLSSSLQPAADVQTES